MLKTIVLSASVAQATLLQDLKNMAFPSAGGAANPNVAVQQQAQVQMQTTTPPPAQAQQPLPQGATVDKDGVVSIPEYMLYLDSVKDMDLM